MNQLQQLWQDHHQAGWPSDLGEQEGELMMLDTVIAGCVTYFLEEKGLDLQRGEIIQDSLRDLDRALPDVPESAMEYFQRLKTMGLHLLDASRSE